MADIEKVKKGLECHKRGVCQIDDKKRCPYWEYAAGCTKQLMSDAIELLKEQQPKEPMQLKYSETREEYWFYESICPKCGNSWISNGTDHFCPACGQPVFEPCEEEQQKG